jgi:two-component system NtrC family sensor kinase
LNAKGLEEVHDRLRQMQVAIDKGSALVARLMRYSRTHVAEIRLVQINDVVNAALELTRPLTTSRVRVKTEISHDLPEVAADPSRLEQVFVNLILNALDAMPGGGELTLSTKLASSDALPRGESGGNKQFVVITVADTGIGIPEHLRRRVFDAFFTTKPDKGAGLGLASARAILEQHKGHIKVESETGSGTTFSIFLPAHPQEEQGIVS